MACVMLFLPDLFTRYIASSAFFMSSSTEAAAFRQVTRPMLKVIGHRFCRMASSRYLLNLSVAA